MTARDLPSAGVTVAPALIRLLDADGVGHGLGLLVAGREIVTCAHVVNLAMGMAGDGAERPEAPVQLDFPFLAPDRRYTAEVVAWRPAAADRSGDIAGLRLHTAPPDGAVPCALADADELYGHRYQVFGFTPAHDTGVWVTGQIRGPDVVGNIQLSGGETGGPRLTPGFSGAPVWDEALQAVVGIASRVTIGRTPPGGYCLPTRLLVEAWPQIEPRTRPPCPYRGLLPMREADAEHFFGREEVSRRLATRLPQGRLNLMVGVSGCGKSSVVRAGILPLLRSRGDLLIAVCRPGVSPVSALVTAFTETTDATSTHAATAHGSVAVDPRAAQADLAAEVERLLDEAGYERFFLVIDQFEELCSHPDELVADVTGMVGRLAATSRPDGRPLCCVVLVARSDFADQITDIPVLADALALDRDDPGEGIHYLLPMTADELRAAIERPVERLRIVRYEDGLVDRLMRDVRRLDNPLASLAFALTRLWELQRGGRIPLAAYEDIGEVAGALRTHFDRVYDEELGIADRETARLLLLRLTAPDGRGGHLRWPVSRDELDERHWTVAQRLAGRRMVTLLAGPDGAEIVELAHDALIDEWPRLRGWLAAEDGFLTWHNALRVAFESWVAADRGDRRLLDGPELTVSLDALATWGDRLMAHERDFIERSRMSQRRRRRRLIAGGTLAVLLAVAVVVASVIAVRVDARAGAERDARAARDLAGDASKSDIFSGLSLTLAAYRTSPTPEALVALSDWNERAALVEKIRQGPLTMTSYGIHPAVSPDGRHAIVPWGDEGRPKLWDLDRSTTPTDAPGDPGLQPRDYGFTASGSHVAYPDPEQIVFWNLRRRMPEWRVPVRAEGTERVTAITVAGDGTALGYLRGNSAYAVDARTGRVLAGPVPARRKEDARADSPLPSLRFDSQSRYLAVVDAERETAVDIRTGRGVDVDVDDLIYPDKPECDTTPTGTSRIDLYTGSRWSSPGSGLSSLPLKGGCEDYEFEVDRGNDELIILHDNAPSDSAVDPGLEIRSLRDGRLLGRYPVPEGSLAAVVPSEHGARVILESHDGLVLLRVPPPGSLARALGMAAHAALTPDGRHVTTLTADGTLSLWEVHTERQVQSVRFDRLRHPVDRYSVIASPDGGRVAAVGEGRVTAIEVTVPYALTEWRIDEQDGWRPVPGAADPYPAMRADFTGAGELLISAGEVFSRWDAAGGRRLGAPLRVPLDQDPARQDDQWTARPGRAQFAVIRPASSTVELWDFERRAAVDRWRPESGARTVDNVVFDHTGSLVAVSWDADTAVVLNVPNGQEVARLPRFDAETPLWAAEDASPITFAGERRLIVDSSTPAAYVWTWPRWRIPLITKDETTVIPVPAGAHGIDDRVSTLLRGDSAFDEAANDEGWRLLPTDPERWRASLCRLYPDGRIFVAPSDADRVRAVEGSLCGDV